MWVAAGMGETTTFNMHRSFEVVCPVRGDHRFNLIVNMRSLSHIVKQLFMKIVIETKCSTSVPRKTRGQRARYAARVSSAQRVHVKAFARAMPRDASMRRSDSSDATRVIASTSGAEFGS